MHSCVRNEVLSIVDMITSETCFIVCLLKEVCISVHAEPHLTNLSVEELFYDTAITGNDARLDIKARRFLRRGQDAWFDVRVTHVNAESQRDLPTAVIFNRSE